MAGPQNDSENASQKYAQNSPQNYEKLGAFYLGRPIDRVSGAVRPEPLLYDAKDLTTHAVIVGMTGSGKTGLAVSILEEAAIDGIPIIAIDPKGDLGNLLLTFPELAANDLRPWIDENDAARKGRTPDEHARATAEQWREGLAEWGQSPERIGRFADAAERTIYTPGSTAGRQLSILRSFDAPGPALLEDEEALRERVQAAVSGLLGLVGIDADPIRSREHILLSTLLDRAWREGKTLDLGAMIQQIQKPPIQRVGVLDLESFFPEKERVALAMAINNLLASPGFASWLEGEPLQVSRLLYTETGRPRISIISIAHLTEPQRMFVVTLVLNQVIAWMRSQPGSRTLRAILYMDEVFGYFPPTANPPSKTPMLTLLKQARAYGLGVVLATQNPVDLDYKGLSNAGTWFLGRLQTERDKARVIEGLEGASTAAGEGFDRAATERTLAGLDSRVFYMNNVHEDEPVLFHTRWALSYLAGPLTREQIRKLTPAGADGAVAEPRAGAAAAPERVPRAEAGKPAIRPSLPAGITERFLPVTRPAGPGERLLYRPSLLGNATLHYASARAKVDEWDRCALLSTVRSDTLGTPWEDAVTHPPLELESEPAFEAAFAELPPDAGRAKSYSRWQKQLKTHLYRTRPLILHECTAPKAVSRPDESEGEFRGRLRDLLREDRDLKVEKLRKRYAPKLRRLKEQIERAEQRVEKEQEQYRDRKLQGVVSIGATLLGALFGRKLASSSNVGRATTAMRGVSRAARERGDIGRAEERVEALLEQLAALEEEFEQELGEFEGDIRVEEFELEELEISPRKSDLDVEQVLLVWAPWRIDRDGIAEPA